MANIRRRTSTLISVLLLVYGLQLPSSLVRCEPAGVFARLFGATEEQASVKDDTGGSNCAACAIIVGIVEQLAEFHNSSIDRELDELCDKLFNLEPLCKIAVDTYGPMVIEALEKKETPDVICHAIGICKTPTGKPMCHIFPLPKFDREHGPATGREIRHRIQDLNKMALRIAKERDLHSLLASLKLGALPKWCKIPGIKQICDIIERWASDHLPADDLDGDYFSDLASARGAAWRGKDCNDSNKAVYPGRVAMNSDFIIDSNCNGIYGMDATSRKSYETLWCANTSTYGTVVLGDSIGAHFHIPPEWMNVTAQTDQSFEHILYILTNELDWPQLSMSTGHFNTTEWASEITGPMDSIYQRLVELNRCNHRDFQNIAVNGARATAMADQIVEGLARQLTADKPALVILELVGNDVCNGHPDTLSDMTKPDVYYKAQLKTLEYLDQHLPSGSHVVLVGLVDGRFLYNNMHDKIHPLGALRSDVTYTDVYDFLSCLGVSPCNGWLTTNESLRNATTAHADLLNVQLQRIATTEKFQNFDVLYTQYDVKTMTAEAAKLGLQAWQLIEPVDGFHLDQRGNALMTQVFWELIEKERPGWIPARNPHNDDIVQRFGDQGGYR